jgi:MSHA type pilus biogenesis protein MshL
LGLLAALAAGSLAAKEPVWSEVPPPNPRAQVTNALPAPPPPPAVPAPEPVPAPALEVPAETAAPATNSTDSLALHTRDKQVFTFRAEDLDLKIALAAFARQNNLNIVPDNDIVGKVTLDVRNLPLTQMMRALLEAGDCSWTEEDGLIRVRNFETRIFAVNYLRMSRNGTGTSTAMLGSGGTGGGGGSGSSGGGGGGGGGSAGGGAGSSGGSGGGGSGSISLDSKNSTDFWKELDEQLKDMLTPAGKKTANMTAGLVQVTDRPSALKRIERFLNMVGTNIHRQVEIEAKLYDVTLNKGFQFGIDWQRITETAAGAATYGASTLPQAIGNRNLGSSALIMKWTNLNTKVLVDALEKQGKVEVISKPRIRTLNNQTALIKVGTEQPFFSQSYVQQQSQSGNVTSSGDTITTVTVGTILSITPQISEDGWISLEISPVLSRLLGREISPSKTATAPILDSKQASSIVRVRDGTTVVMGGLIETESAKNENKVPLLGDIPFVGKLFTGTYSAHSKTELVIFVTPHLVD